MTKNIFLYFVFVVALAIAGITRFHDLGKCASKSDEINQVHYAQSGGIDVAKNLWKNPPWMNQIPLMDSIPGIWCELTHQKPELSEIRQPFAIFGFLTVCFCSIWLLKTRNIHAALLCAIWLGLLPFHLYHSREAYYYAPLMFCSAWLTLRTNDFVDKLLNRIELKSREYIELFLAIVGTCMFHMSGWIVSFACFAWIFVVGCCSEIRKKRHIGCMIVIAFSVLFSMFKWIARAIELVFTTDNTSSKYIGTSITWALPRLIPTMYGGLIFGLILFVFVLVLVIVKIKNKNFSFDKQLKTISLCTLTLFGLELIYTLSIGHTLTKWAYFSSVVPIWIVCSSSIVESVFRKKTIWIAIAIATVLSFPTVQLVSLTGKPIQYKELSTFLNENLDSGDVAIVDRWFEPWNEMSIYPQTNAIPWFIIPDEPIEQYMKMNWRTIAKHYFISGNGLAFVKITNNGDKEMGYWGWAYEWFNHKTNLVNQTALTLTKYGFAPIEGFYLSKNRCSIEILWNTHEEAVNQIFSNTLLSSVAFFNNGFKLYKPWRSGDWNDYRILKDFGVVELWLRPEITKNSFNIICFAIDDKDAEFSIDETNNVILKSGNVYNISVNKLLYPGKNLIKFKVLNGMISIVKITME